MNNLPKYYLVKNDFSQRFRDTVLKYLNETYNQKFSGIMNYYGYVEFDKYNGTLNVDNPRIAPNNPIILSIEEFITLSKEIEEFPEKWFIPITEENHITLYNWWKEQVSSAFLHYWKGGNRPYCVLSTFYDGSYLDYQKEGQNAKMKGCVEITFEQFKKHVLKQTSMETNKKIIGWELKENCKQFEKTIDSIIKSENSFPLFGGETILEINGQKHSIQLLKESGVLELWFSPVYKEEEFKVGDIVVPIPENYQKSFYSQSKHYFDNYFPSHPTKITNFNNNNLSYRNKFVMVEGSNMNFPIDGIRLASKEEIKTYENNLLLEEANKRYPIGSKIKCLNDWGEGKITKHNAFWSSDAIWMGTDAFGDSLTVYKNKIWAEILPSYPQITINGYIGEFFDEYVKFGCAQIDKDLFIGIYNIKTTYNNKALESVTIGKGAFSKKQIKEIAEYYLNKK